MDKFRLIPVAALLLLPLNGVAQSMEIVDEEGVKYAAINTDGMPRYTEDRSENSDFYADGDLYTYSSDGTTSEPMLDNEGNPIVVKRMKRHRTEEDGNKNVSKRFIVSPTRVYSDGKTNNTGSGTETMNWATANGYLASANSNSASQGFSATSMGCSVYRGKNGSDPEGTWRTPTQKEGLLIAIFYKDLENTSADTGFQPFADGSQSKNGAQYWLATEARSSSNRACYIHFYPESVATLYKTSDMPKTNTYYLRCIRDIEVK